jgi:hypothetical protein
MQQGQFTNKFQSNPRFLTEIEMRLQKVIYYILNQNILNIDSKILNKIFDIFNYSLFEGEYYNNNANSKLENIKLLVNNIQNQVSEKILELENEQERLKETNSTGKDNKTTETEKDLLKNIYEEIEVSINADIFNDYIKYFNYLVEHVTNKTAETGSEVISYSIDEEINNYIQYLTIEPEKQVEENKQELELVTPYILFLINIKLCIIDEGHICAEDELKKLIFYSSKLFECKGTAVMKDNFILRTLLYKANFFIYKILYRFNKTENKQLQVISDRENFKYDLEHLSKKDEPNEKNKNYFIHLIERIKKINPKGDDELITLKSECANILRKTENDIKEKKYTFEIGNLILVSKYLKNDLENIVRNNIAYDDYLKYDRVIKVLSSIEDEIHNKGRAEDLFNKFAFHSGIMIVVNTIYALKLHKLSFELDENTSTKNIQEILSKSKTLLDDYLNKYSFFENENINIYRLFLNGVIKITDKFHKVLNSENFRPSYEELSAFIENHFEEDYKLANVIKNKLTFAKSNKDFPLYLTIEECFIESKEINEFDIIETYQNTEQINTSNECNKINLFLDSTYILPSNYEFINNEIENYDFKIRNNQSLIFQKLLFNKNKTTNADLDKKFADERDKNQKDIDDKLKQNQLNTIQVIGLYASFITFVLGSVSIIPKFEKSTAVILLFLLVFAAALTFFVFLLRLIISNSNDKVRLFGVKNKTGKWLFNTPTAFMYFSIILIIIICITFYNIKDHKYDEIQPVKINQQKFSKEYSDTINKVPTYIKTEMITKDTIIK